MKPPSLPHEAVSSPRLLRIFYVCGSILGHQRRALDVGAPAENDHEILGVIGAPGVRRTTVDDVHHWLLEL